MHTQLFLVLLSQKEQFSICQGCLICGTRAVIAVTLTSGIFHKLHEGYLGIVKNESPVQKLCGGQRLIFKQRKWQNIVKVVNKYNTCPNILCCTLENGQLSHGLISTQTIYRIYILIAVDAHCKCPEVFCMNSTSSAQMVLMFRLLFSRTKDPEQIVTLELHLHLQKKWYQTCHINSYHPDTNGLMGGFMQT